MTAKMGSGTAGMGGAATPDEAISFALVCAMIVDLCLSFTIVNTFILEPQL